MILHDFVSPGDKRKSQNKIFGSVSNTTLPCPCCVLNAVSPIMTFGFCTFFVTDVSAVFSSFVAVQ